MIHQIEGFLIVSLVFCVRLRNLLRERGSAEEKNFQLNILGHFAETTSQFCIVAKAGINSCH